MGMGGLFRHLAVGALAYLVRKLGVRFRPNARRFRTGHASRIYGLRNTSKRVASMAGVGNRERPIRPRECARGERIASRRVELAHSRSPDTGAMCGPWSI